MKKNIIFVFLLALLMMGCGGAVVEEETPALSAVEVAVSHTNGSTFCIHSGLECSGVDWLEKMSRNAKKGARSKEQGARRNLGVLSSWRAIMN